MKLLKELITAGLVLICSATGQAMDIFNRSGCNDSSSSPEEYIQLRVEEFRAGQKLFRAWRIFTDNRVESALWDGRGQLIRVAKKSILSPGIYSLLQNIQFNNQQQSKSPAIILGRSARIVIITRFGDKNTESQVYESANEKIYGVIDELRNMSDSMIKPGAGDYFWIEPISPLLNDKSTLDLTKDCESIAALAIHQAISSSHLIEKFNIDQLATDKTLFPAIEIPITVRAETGWFLIGRLTAGK